MIHSLFLCSDLNLNVALNTNFRRERKQEMRVLFGFLKQCDDPAIDCVEESLQRAHPYLTMRVSGIKVKFTMDRTAEEDATTRMKLNLEDFPVAEPMSLVFANALLARGIKLPLYIIINLAIFLLEVRSFSAACVVQLVVHVQA